MLYFPIITNWISFFVGRILAVPLPRLLRRRVIMLYAKAFGADVSEASRNLSEYRSLSAFFVRELRPGIRPLGEGAVSPVDGRLVDFGMVHPEGTFTIKGMNYDLEALFVDRELAGRFCGGSFLSFYLSPRDYHHIHSPVHGELKRMIHVEGALLPVNNFFFSRVKRLFAFNERILTLIDSPDFGLVGVIAVGALNVGSITVCYDSYRANAPRRLLRLDKRVHVRHYQGIELERGSRIARFEMGSSVLVFFQPGAVRLTTAQRGASIRVAEKIGEVSSGAGAA